MAQEQQLKKIAEGREAEMFAWEGGTILRLMRSADGVRQNEMQMAAIEAARASGVRVPAVVGSATVMDRPGLIMERIDGVDYLTLMGKQPWTVFEVGSLSGHVHAKLHGAVASEALPALRAVLRARIQACERIPEQLARFAVEALDRLPDGDRLCHGDFHPGNLLRSRDGPVVIDWTNASRGDPDADVARTNLMLRVGEPPPGSPVIVRLLARVGGRVLLWRYLRSYRRSRAVSDQALSGWAIPIGAARIAEGIESEIPILIKFLEKAQASSAQL
jgi:aminoglycoside phosphotransferase (APT) family kinase protein